MIRIVHYDGETYGLAEEETAKMVKRLAVYEPFIDSDGIDWSAIRPDWMTATAQ